MRTYRMNKYRMLKMHSESQIQMAKQKTKMLVQNYAGASFSVLKSSYTKDRRESNELCQQQMLARFTNRPCVRPIQSSSANIIQISFPFSTRVLLAVQVASHALWCETKAFS